MTAGSVSGRRIRIRGQVQGVGFRPCVWQLAVQMQLTGWVQNDTEGVLIHVYGRQSDRLEHALVGHAPVLARIDSVVSEKIETPQAPAEFLIVESSGQGNLTSVTPDAALCKTCIDEIIDPDQRRFDYAFTHCVHCGPRFSILHNTPYDRATTSMACFMPCAMCQAEYENPYDRRFHAQAIACPDCGPRIWLEIDGREIPGDPLQRAVGMLGSGKLVAVKGIGGFHLLCDALNTAAINTLRQRKQRPDKPLAVMATLDMIQQRTQATHDQLRLLADPAAVIVLLDSSSSAMPAVLAPGLDELGWMVPYTPLHHLLVAACQRPLVATSGNLTSEPQAITNLQARGKLGNIADALLMHDRDILVRLDDGVERNTSNGRMVLRRARGRVPGALPLPPGFDTAPDVIACGGQKKSTICLIKDGQAILSHHLGDLDDAQGWDAYLHTINHFASLFNHQPSVIACDLHPEYRASIYARSQTTESTLVEVQHHHAHLAACMAENRWPVDAGPVAGIILDGLGWGLDGTIWGGEVLVGDYFSFERTASLLPAPLAGGDAAQREPWRNALLRLDQAGLGDLADQLFGNVVTAQQLVMMRQAVKNRINAPPSSSAGRLFDAMAACLDLAKHRQSYEGQAAMLLEAMARRAPDPPDIPYPVAQNNGLIDPVPMFRAWARDYDHGVAREIMAARFTAGIARAFARAARHEVETGRANAVALSGGCFQNALLLELVIRELSGLTVLTHSTVPANDGGLALGQALIAAAHNSEQRHA